VAHLLWSATLLTAGFLAVVGLGATIASANAAPGRAGSVQAAFVIYASVVLAKGLLPALVLAFALWCAVGRGERLRAHGRAAEVLAVLAAATLGSVAAAGLMSLRIAGLPAVHYTGTGNFLRTCAEMAGPVALALWLPRALEPWLARYRALVLAGLLVLFVTGSASISHFARRPAAAPEPPIAGATEAPATAPDVPAAPTPPPADVAAIPLTGLPLQLLQVHLGAEPSQSVALIADTERALPYLMRVGSAFADYPGVKVTAIAAAYVLIDDLGRIERLDLNPNLALTQPAAPAEPPSTEERERRRAIAQRVRAWIDAGPRATEVAMVGGLLAAGDPVPVYEDGELTGIELRNVQPDGLYARLGLRDGDRVQAINGVSLTDPEASGAILRALSEAPQIELSVQRGNAAPAPVAVPREQLLEALRAFD
jgi:type II secretion system protein C